MGAVVKAHNVEAERYRYQQARDLVVSVSGTLYVQALAALARADAAKVQRQTAEAIYRQAADLKQSGLVAGIDVLRAELADAEAASAAASVPITSTQVTGHVTTARSGLAQAQGGIAAAEREIDMSRARLATAQARVREAEANGAKAARDVERLRGLLAKDEVSQQQFDTTVVTAEAQKAAAGAARAQAAEAEAGIRVAESRLAQAQAGEQQARAELQTAQTGPQQVAAARERAQARRPRTDTGSGPGALPPPV